MYYLEQCEATFIRSTQERFDAKTHTPGIESIKISCDMCPLVNLNGTAEGYGVFEALNQANIMMKEHIFEFCEKAERYRSNGDELNQIPQDFFPESNR